MRIAIIGAGAMGSIFGAMLSSVSDVYLIDPFEAHIEAINQNGLVIESADGTSKTYSVFASTDPNKVKPGIDLSIIFTKAYLTEEAARTAIPLMAEEGLMLTLQNGLGNVEAITKVMGKGRALAGVTSHGGTLLSPGLVRHEDQGATYIANVSHHAEKLNQIIDTFQAGGIETSISENLDSVLWGNLLINVGINALAAILHVPIGVLGETPACTKIMANAVLEAETVARSFGIELPYANPLQEIKKVCQNRAESRASMFQDIMRGTRTEIAAINRAVARRGKVLGISTPYNTFLAEIIEALEATAEKRIKS